MNIVYILFGPWS